MKNLTSGFDLNKLRELLDSEMCWPTHYYFKFIVKTEYTSLVKELLMSGNIELKPSKNGRYISVSCKYYCEEPDEVIAIYQQASKIEGIISL